MAQVPDLHILVVSGEVEWEVVEVLREFARRVLRMLKELSWRIYMAALGRVLGMSARYSRRGPPPTVSPCRADAYRGAKDPEQDIGLNRAPRISSIS